MHYGTSINTGSNAWLADPLQGDAAWEMLRLFMICIVRKSYFIIFCIVVQKYSVDCSSTLLVSLQIASLCNTDFGRDAIPRRDWIQKPPLYEHINQESAVEVIKARDPYEIKYAHAGRQSYGHG